jgi:hypothetical protein
MSSPVAARSAVGSRLAAATAAVAIKTSRRAGDNGANMIGAIEVRHRALVQNGRPDRLGWRRETVERRNGQAEERGRAVRGSPL